MKVYLKFSIDKGSLRGESSLCSAAGNTSESSFDGVASSAAGNAIECFNKRNKGDKEENEYY